MKGNCQTDTDDTDTPNRFMKACITILAEKDGKNYAYKEWKQGFREQPKILDSKGARSLLEISTS